jgi:hypothetical protein
LAADAAGAALALDRPPVGYDVRMMVARQPFDSVLVIPTIALAISLAYRIATSDGIMEAARSAIVLVGVALLLYKLADSLGRLPA